MSEKFREYSDERLISLVKENVPDAFAELTTRYFWLVSQKTSQFSGPAAPEREDLLQEGFLGLYAAAVTYDEDSKTSFKTYAAICVQNRMSDAAKRHGSAKNRVLNESLSLDSDDTSDMATQSSPEELIELREHFQDLLRRANIELTSLERKALSLYLSGCKRTEISERSGMTLKTFDNAIYRVRNKLRGT